MSPADPSLPGTGHCYRPHSLYFKPQWTLLETLPLCNATVKSGVSYRPCTLWDRGFLLKTLYFVTADTGLCLLQTLHSATLWTLESPTDPLYGVAEDTSVSTADPIHCGIVDTGVSCKPYTLWQDTGVSCRPSTWCRSGHIGVSRKAYTLWHRGQWCLLQTLCTVAKWTLESPADPLHHTTLLRYVFMPLPNICSLQVSRESVCCCFW